MFKVFEIKKNIFCYTHHPPPFLKEPVFFSSRNFICVSSNKEFEEWGGGLDIISNCLTVMIFPSLEIKSVYKFGLETLNIWIFETRSHFETLSKVSIGDKIRSVLNGLLFGLVNS